MGLILDDGKSGGVMFNESTLAFSNPLINSVGYANGGYIKEDYQDVWEKRLDENIDAVLIKFRGTPEYKKATKGMSAQKRKEFDIELKNKVKTKIIGKKNKVDKIFTAFALAGLVMIIAAMFIVVCAPMAGIVISAAGWGVTLITFIVQCVRYIAGGDDVSKEDIMKVIEEVI